MKSMEKIYPHATTGSHVSSFGLVFNKEESVEKVLETIRKKEGFWPQSESIFVTDHTDKLIGKVDFKILTHASPSEKLINIMETKFFMATAHSHQKTIAKAAIKEGLENIPVIDSEEHFVGIVDSAQILKILHEEHVENLLKYSGISANQNTTDIFKTRLKGMVKARFPWLAIGLIGGILSTLIISKFELTLEKELSLAFFIPVIVYINDAVGTQTQTIFVRLAFFEKINLKKYLLQELKVGTLIAFLLSLSIFLYSWIVFGLTIALIVSLSMFIGIMSSIIIAILIPWLFERFNRDPAIGSGPFSTIIQDLLSITIYFMVASLLLK